MTLLLASNSSGQDEIRAVPALSLTTTILDTRSCSADAEVFSVQLKLRLEYLNIQDSPVILDKGSSIVSEIMVSQNIEAAKRHEYEIRSSQEVFGETTERASFGAVPDKRFVVLKPGESYVTQATIALAVRHKDAQTIPGAIRTGDHYVQIVVPTWFLYPENVANSLRKKWAKVGTLQTGTIVSEPMHFTVQKRPLKECK